MKIAVPIDKDGAVSPIFGGGAFKIFEVKEGKVAYGIDVEVPKGHAVAAGFLSGMGVKDVICGKIGEDAVKSLNNAGIAIYPEQTGDAREAASLCAEGKLTPLDAGDTIESSCESCPLHASGCTGCE